MKTFFLLLALIFLFSAPVALADTVQCGQNQTTPSELCNPLEGKVDRQGGAIAVIFTGIEIIILIIGGTAIVYVVYSGARMILSQGGAEEVQKGKDILKWSIYGFALSVIAFVLTNSLASFFGYRGVPFSIYRDSTHEISNPVATNSFGVWFYQFNDNFLSFVGILAIIMIVISGIRYITAQGHEEQAQNAKQALRWSLIGLALTILAYVIIRSVEALIAGR